MKKILEWFKQNLSNPQAYLMEGPITKMVRYLRVRRIFAVFMVFGVFLIAFLTLLFVLLPFVSREIADVAADVPRWPAKISAQIERIPEKYPAYTNQISMVSDLIEGDWLRNSVQSTPKAIADIVPAFSKKIITILIYTVIVPLLVLYFLKDKEKIREWCASFLPEDQDRSLAKKVWSDVDRQTANYVRGKFLEIIIVWSVSYVVFRFIGLQYSMVLSLFTGLSVLLPYVGATVMFIPVAIVAITQPGLPVHPGWVILAYGIIQLLDGNVLAPLLLSEVTNLHPIAIIAAILLFGGIWGFWGVFFAIPLATLVNAVITAWPTRRNLARAQNVPERTMGKRQWATAVSALFAFVAIMVLLNYKGRPKKIDPTNPGQPLAVVPEPLPPSGPVVLEVERGVLYKFDGKLLSFSELEEELSRLRTAAVEREVKIIRDPTAKADDLLDVWDAMLNAGISTFKINNLPGSEEDPDGGSDKNPDNGNADKQDAKDERDEREKGSSSDDAGT